MAKGTILLAAGGTGGHLFPAEALAHALHERGWQVHLATDKRAARFSGDFPAAETHIVESATFGSKNPFALLRAGWTIWRGVKQASALLQRLKPAAVVGFGGYPTLPPLWAATRRGVPALIHEQNAVMGRANKALAARVQAIAGVTIALMSPLLGAMADAAGPRKPWIVASMLMCATGCFGLWFAIPGEPLFHVMVSLIVAAVGMEFGHSVDLLRSVEFCERDAGEGHIIVIQAVE